MHNGVSNLEIYSFHVICGRYVHGMCTSYNYILKIFRCTKVSTKELTELTEL